MSDNLEHARAELAQAKAAAKDKAADLAQQHHQTQLLLQAQTLKSAIECVLLLL